MRKTVVLLVIVAGVLVALGGVAAALGLSWLSLRPERDPLTVAALAAAALIFGVGLGGVWLWAGRQIGRGAIVRALRLPHWGWLVVALAVVLALGQAAVSAGWAVPAAVLHVLAGALPPLVFLSLAVDAAAWRWGMPTSSPPVQRETEAPQPLPVAAEWMRAEAQPETATGPGATSVAEETVPAGAVQPLGVKVPEAAAEPPQRQAAPIPAAGRVSARAAWSSLAWGGAAAVPLAMILELVLFALLVIAVMAWFAATQPGLLQQLQRLPAQAQAAPGGVPDLSGLMPLVTSPVVLLGGFLLLGVLAPLTEEICKTLAVPFVALAGRRLTRLDGFMFGLAAGAGFAMLEGTGYGIMGLQTPGSWAGTMLMRAGTAAIHCLASGLAGLGWQALIVERRWGRGLGLGLGGALLHGAWNTLAIGVALPPLLSAAGRAGFALRNTTLVVTMAACAGLLGLTWLGAVIAIPLIARRLAHQNAGVVL